MLGAIASTYRTPSARQFLGAVVAFAVGAGLFLGVLNNYLHEILAITRVERGIVEFPRELPGLMLFGLLALLYRFSERKIMAVAMIVAMAGLIGLILAGAVRASAIVLIVLWSTGEHLMMPVRSSIAVHLASPGKEGLALGAASSAGNLGQVAGYYIVPLIFILIPRLFPSAGAFLPFRMTFAVAALAMCAALFLTRRIDERGVIARKRLYFRRRYTRYYILEAFFGARKQVFLTFAPYVLILRYGARTELIASLYGIWSLTNIFLSPLVGKLIDRVGYKKIIVVDTIVLTLLCLLYGFSHRLFSEGTAFIVVCVVFVLDAILFVAGMARTMYVKSVSRSQDEVTSTLSAGISINHLVSIVIAIAGGIFWERLGMETLFSFAALLALGSFVFALNLPRPAPAATREE